MQIAQKKTLWNALAILTICILLMSFITKCYSAYPYIDSKGQSHSFDTEEELQRYINEELAQILADTDTGNDWLMSEAVANITDYISLGVDRFGTWIVAVMVNSFNPSFGPLFSITYGYTNTVVSMETALAMTEAEFASNIIVGKVFLASKNIGMVLLFIILITNLMLCIFGKAHQIQTNPLKLLFNGVIAFLLIGWSFKFIIMFQTVICNLWTVVMTSNDTPLSWAAFKAGRNALTSTASRVGNTILDGTSTTAFAVSLFAGPIGWVVYTILFLILIWKPVKGFIKLYFEIAARYFILTFLLLFSPIIIPTMVSPSSSDIFKKYLRQLVVQGILMIMQGVMMTFFVSVLIQGGWFQSSVNYISCLAFLRMAEKLDTYCDSMGISSIKANGDFMTATRGFFGSLAEASRNINLLGNAGSKIASTQMTAGLIKNDSALYEKGFQLANTRTRLAGVSTPELQRASESSFNEAILRQADLPATNDQISYNNLADAINSHNVPSTYQDELSKFTPAEQEELSNLGVVQTTSGDIKFMTEDGHVRAVGHDGKIKMAENTSAPKKKSHEAENSAKWITPRTKQLTDANPYQGMKRGYEQRIAGYVGGKQMVPSEIGSYSAIVPEKATLFTVELDSNSKGTTTRQGFVVPAGTYARSDVPFGFSRHERDEVLEDGTHLHVYFADEAKFKKNAPQTKDAMEEGFMSKNHSEETGAFKNT